MEFPGWTEDDFAIFTVEGFEDRMALIRERIQPKLDALGRDLLPLLEEETGSPWFHHVAKHMRRTVNPPRDTWVALNRVKRGYKATVHFSAGLSALGANACLIAKPECLERETLAAALHEGADRWPVQFRRAKGLYLGDVPNAPEADLQPATGAPAEVWRGQAESLRRRKQFEFEMGRRIRPADAARMDGEAFVRETVRHMRGMLPLYTAGIDTS